MHWIGPSRTIGGNNGALPSMKVWNLLFEFKVREDALDNSIDLVKRHEFKFEASMADFWMKNVEGAVGVVRAYRRLATATKTTEEGAF